MLMLELRSLYYGIKNMLIKKKCTNIIAEIGSVHDGSFGNAIKLIELANDCNADCVKFQTHISEAETLKNAPMPSFFKGEPRYKYFERTSFSQSQWKKLKFKCDEHQIEFLSSPFSIQAVDLLENIGVTRYKVPSGDVTNHPMLELIAQTRKPVILSSGMSSWKELDEAVNIILKFHKNITILQCTSEYPCSYENVGINIMLEIKNRYNLPVGLSDHTLSNYSAFLAVSLGASIIEKHLTFSQKMYGSDGKHSLEPNEFKDLVKGIRAFEIMLSTKVDKNKEATRLIEMKNVFQKSIVANCNIRKGTLLEIKHLAFKKPGTGISANRYKEVLGKKILKDIQKNKIISMEDFE